MIVFRFKRELLCGVKAACLRMIQSVGTEYILLGSGSGICFYIGEQADLRRGGENSVHDAQCARQPYRMHGIMHPAQYEYSLQFHGTYKNPRRTRDRNQQNLYGGG